MVLEMPTTVEQLSPNQALLSLSVEPASQREVISQQKIISQRSPVVPAAPPETWVNPPESFRLAPKPIKPQLIEPQPIESQPTESKLQTSGQDNQKQESQVQAPQVQAPQVHEPQIQVQKIQVQGSTIFSEAELAAIVKPFEGKSLDLTALKSIADSITQEYLSLGYLTSRAILSEQTVTNGLVQIQVIEGRLEKIEILGNKRVGSDYVRQRIQLGAQSPLNQQKLEDQLRLLKFDPLFENVEASLKEGTGAGQSILTVRVAEAKPVFANLTLDNDSVPSVGGERIGLTAGYRNLTGQGDILYGSYNRSLTGGASLLDIGYQIPLNPMQGTLQLRVSPSQYRITQKEFKALGIEGSSTVYDLAFRQPLLRSPRQELALSLGVNHRTGKTLISDFLIDQSTTTVLRFGQEWVKRDPKGIWSLRSQFNLGTTLLGATQNQDPDGQFFSWSGQAERMQLLSADHTLRLHTNWQLTPHALLPSQQFVMGGRQSLRGFRQNQRSADNGLSASIEHQITLHRNAAGEAIFQVSPFIDAGVVWNNPDNVTSLPDKHFLAGLGIGLNWKPTAKINLRLDYGIPLIRLPERENNLQDAAFYFSFNYQL